MNADAHKARSIFLAAVENCAPDQWQDFVQEACAGDQELYRRVELLLQAHRQSNSLLDSPGSVAIDTADAPPIPECPGTVIGPYKLLEQIGEGGFGVVFMAEQQEPIRRKVALKILKPGMDTKQVIARFEAERQALALMDHTNIARLLGGGETASGRPYFVMELVRGIPITEFCDQSRLPVRERIELLLSVCQAVQHAHQKGIIHRDIKPSNVLVTLNDGTPLVKVIDFGIAKALGQQLTDRTLFTGFIQLIGTPLYMSPEQAALSNLDVDTRSDIYSLGVLLYELLTGTTPFDKQRLRSLGYDEIRRIISEEEPPKPSTRVSTLAKAASTLSTQRKTDPKRLSQLFRAELDWIVMKCLEKDRNRRYETANGLAMDLRRYLADEPVHACPPSTIYRLRKFARKYRTLLRIAVVFVVFLVLATAVSTWQAVRATLAERRVVQERDRAEKSFRTARDAVDRLFTQVSQSPTLKAHGMDKFRKELLQNAKEFYERFIREQFDAPGVRYDLGLAQYRLGEIYRELGDYAAAEESLTKALALLGEQVQAQPDEPTYQRDLAASYVALGLVCFARARWEEAEAAFEQALAIQEKQAAAYPKVAEYRYALAKTYREFGFMHGRVDRPDRAGKRYQQALDVLSKLVEDYPLPEHQSLLAETQMHLGNMYLAEGWVDKAEQPLKEAQRVFASLVRGRPDAPPEYWQSLGRCHAILGMAYHDQTQTGKAEAAQKQALEIFEKLIKEHPDVVEYAYDRGRCYIEFARAADQGGRPDAALARYDKAIEILEGVMEDRRYRAARPMLLKARINRAAVLAARGDHARATAEEEVLARQAGLLPTSLYDICCAFSRASAAVDHDGKLSPAERARLKARYANRAMEFLQRAVAKGWNHPQALRTDPDVEPLRAREDFRKQLAELEAKAKE